MKSIHEYEAENALLAKAAVARKGLALRRLKQRIANLSWSWRGAEAQREYIVRDIRIAIDVWAEKDFKP